MTGRVMRDLLLVGVPLSLAFVSLLARDTPSPLVGQGNDRPLRPAALTGEDEALARQGASLFRLRGCLGCHQVKGAGGMIGPDLSLVGSRWSREALFDQLEGHTVLMPDFAHLSPEEKRELVEYLMTLR